MSCLLLRNTEIKKQNQKKFIDEVNELYFASFERINEKEKLIIIHLVGDHLLDF